MLHNLIINKEGQRMAFACNFFLIASPTPRVLTQTAVRQHSACCRRLTAFRLAAGALLKLVNLHHPPGRRNPRSNHVREQMGETLRHHTQGCRPLLTIDPERSLLISKVEACMRCQHSLSDALEVVVPVHEHDKA